MGKYFGTDGVRGEANVELTPELAFKLGRFGGYVLSQHETGRPKVFVARDTRISGAISIAYKGNFIHDLSVQEFEQELSLILLKEQEPRQSFFQRWMGGSKK